MPHRTGGARGRQGGPSRFDCSAARNLTRQGELPASTATMVTRTSGPTCAAASSVKTEDAGLQPRSCPRGQLFPVSFCSQDGNLPTLISSVHRSRHLVMPEHQSRCEFQRGSLEIGLRPGLHLLGRRGGGGPPPSVSPIHGPHPRPRAPRKALGAVHTGRVVWSVAHAQCSRARTAGGRMRAAIDRGVTAVVTPTRFLLRVRQEVAAAALRGPSGLEAHLPSSTAGQRRKQGLAQHREGAAPAAAPSFSERELPQPPPLLSPQNAPHIALGPHLRPPFLGVPSALCQTPGYGFLPHAQAEMFARQQELLRKQNLARLELPADLLRQKELESARPQLLAPETALRPNDGAEELQRRGALLVLNHGAAPLLALPPQGPPGSGPPTPSRDSARRAPRKGGPGPASARPSESKEMTGARLWAQDGSEDEPPKDSDGEDTETAAAGCRGPTPGQAPAGGAGAEGKGLFPGSTLPPPLPLGFPYAVSPYFHTGAVGGLSVDGEEAPAPEDVTKWTVDDVCSFVGGLSGCGEYTRVFREQGIDGETLPLLTEEHLLSTMGLKLGPALKIRAQVARRLGRVFYVASFPVALPLQPPTLRAPERELGTGEQPLSPTTATSPYGGGHALAGRTSPKQENGTLALLPGAPDPSQPLC
uniref:SAM domain-containing protein n=1 Tax=Pan troglodytes TaxID=9598 RepID=A0A2I3SPH7_PANTR